MIHVKSASSARTAMEDSVESSFSFKIMIMNGVWLENKN